MSIGAAHLLATRVDPTSTSVGGYTFTAPANCRAIVVVCLYQTSGSLSPSAAWSTGGTFTTAMASTTGGYKIAVLHSPSPATGSVTISGVQFNASNTVSAAVLYGYVTGSNGVPDIVQSNWTASSGAFTPTLGGAARSSDSRTFAAYFGNAMNTMPKAGTNFTLLASTAAASSTDAEWQWRADAFTSSAPADFSGSAVGAIWEVDEQQLPPVRNLAALGVG